MGHIEKLEMFEEALFEILYNVYGWTVDKTESVINLKTRNAGFEKYGINNLPVWR